MFIEIGLMIGIIVIALAFGYRIRNLCIHPCWETIKQVERWDLNHSREMPVGYTFVQRCSDCGTVRRKKV